MELGTTSFVGCLSLWSIGGLGVVLSKWGGGGPWLGGLVGCLWWDSCHLALCYFYVAVWRIRGVPLPYKWVCFPWFLIQLVLVFSPL